MKVKIEGNLRQRTRIKVLWFWIVTGWKNTPFTYEQELAAGRISWVPIKNVPIEVRLSIVGPGAAIDLRFAGQNLWGADIDLQQTGFPIHWEPIKGVIVDAQVSVS